MSATITRKELAYDLKKCVRTVVNHEKEWGLSRCRSNASKRPIEYFEKEAKQALRSARVIR